jgi:hypothetical protein
LAYYFQWHLTQRLKPLFGSYGQGKNRQWTIQNVLEILKGIRWERVKINNVEIEITMQPDWDQQQILDLLKTTPSP